MNLIQRRRILKFSPKKSILIQSYLKKQIRDQEHSMEKKIQSYHGGTLTGGDILMLLEKYQLIMDDITSICHEYVNQIVSMPKNSLPSMTIEAVDKMLDEHCILFQAQDVVYAHLRLINPSPQEMLETR